MGVAFMEPLFWVVVCMRAACRTWGGLADVRSGKATTSYVAFRSRRWGTSRSQPSCVFKQVWLNRAFASSARPGEELCSGFWAISRSEGVFDMFTPRGRCVERGKRRVGLVLCRGFVGVIRRGVPRLGFQPVKATDPPVTFRMRQVDPSSSACSWLGVMDTSRCTGPQLVLFPVPHFRELGPESLKVPGMGLQQCGLQEWCWLVSTVCWLVLVERQFDLSSVAVGLRGSSVWFVRVDCWCREPVFVARGSFPTELVTREAHPYSFQVRESRRLLALLLVPSRIVAE
ncbi:hypothetical protein Taro_009907 [Colocasia esculenta]|uniref:Secreted protein n=1 Tax=Colocasia esculenta TaxID=4460 RepID=A0A843U5D8_COLES|nr:hypothetical protein [Colocasia esculenta]